MEWTEWEQHYEEILADMGYDRDADARAAHLLSHLLPYDPESALVALIRLIKGSYAIIIGDGPDFETELDQVLAKVSLEKARFEKAKLAWDNRVKDGLSGSGLAQTDLKEPEPPLPHRLVVADGAASRLLAMSIVPDVIVTDLDGDVEKQVQANERGALVVVHAHGDNIPTLNRWVPKFKGQILGSTQGIPLSNVFNFGGFTDGDRAAYLVSDLGAKHATLLGFDFKEPTPKPGSDSALKKRKLIWAKNLLEMLSRNFELSYGSGEMADEDGN